MDKLFRIESKSSALTQASEPQLWCAGLQLQEAFDLDPWIEEALVSRCCLPLLAALLHVPKLQALHQKQAGSLMPGQVAEHIQVTSHPLLLPQTAMHHQAASKASRQENANM